MNIYETLLLFALVCALAAFFVMWAKLEEEKLKTREERKCYEAMLRLHNTTAEAAQRVSDYLDTKTHLAEHDLEYALRVSMENIELQDRLSALLCPMNDHVWKDGRCVKCGRMKDALS